MTKDNSGELQTFIAYEFQCLYPSYYPGNWKLSREHSYYYQVQVQLNVCDVQYGDFVVWTENGIASERIEIDREFYEKESEKVKHIFTYGVLPEIVGKWYTRKHVADVNGIVRPPTPLQDSSTDTEEDPEKPWCNCGQPTYGQMIMCEHKKCTIH